MAKRKEGKERPDIIILDYFFGIEELNPEQQYGHKFIRQLKDRSIQVESSASFEKGVRLNPITCAFGKYWIFPISAFEYAFRSHLRLMGDTANLSHIEIGDGADPINSPELFRYLFFSFLRFQKEQIHIDLKEVNTVIEFERFTTENFDQTDYTLHLESILRRYYYSIVDLNNKLLRIKNECEYSSLAEGYLRKNDHYLLQHVLSRFQHMVHMIIYGSMWDWPQIWKEFQALHTLKDQAERRQEDQFQQSPVSLLLNPEFMDHIAHYITTLKQRTESR